MYPVSRPLIDRMEIVELDSYTEYEKLHIAKQYLIKQARKENGLEKISMSITDKAISRIINEYTAEPGVRNLKRQIIKLCRKLARIVVEEEKESIKIGVKDLENYLGKPIYRKEMRRKEETRIGSVNGLGVTSVGGCTLPVQAVTVPGKGGLSVTGKLGEVMKESVEVAFNYVKSNLEHYVPYDKEFLRKKYPYSLPGWSNSERWTFCRNCDYYCDYFRSLQSRNSPRCGDDRRSFSVGRCSADWRSKRESLGSTSGRNSRSYHSGRKCKRSGRHSGGNQRRNENSYRKDLCRC